MQTPSPAPRNAFVPIRVVPRASGASHVAQPLCSECHLRGLCLPAGLPDRDVEHLDALMFARRRVRPDEPLYHQGESFRFVYAVRGGTVKTTLGAPDGREQISGFHLPGDILGLDGLASGRHATTARALEDAQVCAIPYAQLVAIGRTHSALREAISRLLSREIVREHAQVSMLAGINAEERLAAFLLNLSRRARARGWSSRELNLRMSRADIGSYLGVTLETVSRTLSAFQRRGLLEVRRKRLRLDPDALARAFELHV